MCIWHHESKEKELEGKEFCGITTETVDLVKKSTTLSARDIGNVGNADKIKKYGKVANKFKHVLQT